GRLLGEMSAMSRGCEHRSIGNAGDDPGREKNLYGRLPQAAVRRRERLFDESAIEVCLGEHLVLQTVKFVIAHARKTALVKSKAGALQEKSFTPSGECQRARGQTSR